MPSFITNSEQETFALAKTFASRLCGGEIILLFGDLGAGKTVFAKGIAAGLGIKKTVTSPTFVLMNQYQIRGRTSVMGSQKGAKQISNVPRYLLHIDTYRLQHAQDLKDIGVMDYFGRRDVISVIEWPEKVKSLIHGMPDIKVIHIKITGSTRKNLRNIDIS